MQERRRHDRSRAFQAGTVARQGCRAALECVVRDLSEGGALLLLDEPLRAPSEMDLTVARDGGRFRARVVWRSEAGVGVAFAAVDAEVATNATTVDATVVSLDAVRRSRQASAPDRLAERIAGALRPQGRPRPSWA